MQEETASKMKMDILVLTKGKGFFFSTESGANRICKYREKLMAERRENICLTKQSGRKIT